MKAYKILASELPWMPESEGWERSLIISVRSITDDVDEHISVTFWSRLKRAFKNTTVTESANNIIQLLVNKKAIELLSICKQ